MKIAFRDINLLALILRNYVPVIEQGTLPMPSINLRPWTGKSPIRATASKDKRSLKAICCPQATTKQVLREAVRLDRGNRFELSSETSGKWSRAKVIDTIGWIYTPYIIKD